MGIKLYNDLFLWIIILYLKKPLKYIHIKVEMSLLQSKIFKGTQVPSWWKIFLKKSDKTLETRFETDYIKSFTSFLGSNWDHF